MDIGIEDILFGMLHCVHWVPNSKGNGTIGCDVDCFLTPGEYQKILDHFPDLRARIEKYNQDRE